MRSFSPHGCVFSLISLVCLGAFVGTGRSTAGADPDPKGLEFFEKKIRPILATHCQQCHSEMANQNGKLKGGLLLDSKAGMLSGGDSGPALVPGKAKESLLVQALRQDGLKMPPSGKLPDAVIADFETWVNMGAPDPRAGDGASLIKSTIDLEAGRKYWAFQPVKKPAAPTNKGSNWARGDIDRFILAKLDEKKLAPVSDASRSTLIRRIYFDLIGLPPSPDEIDAFVRDNSPKALEKVVDRLLNAPQFGERWGRHWLDIARYAESNGNVDNNLFPYAWRYRDYVIASLNADKPYDRFITEQLAGDLLDADSPQQKNDLLVATGFLALTSKPRSQNNPDFAMDLVADQIEVTTTGLLGITVACARCHDHKFDPVPQTDYYALAGFFTSSEMLYGVMTRNNKAEKGNGRPKVHALMPDVATEAPDGVKAAAAEVAKLREQRDELRRQMETAQEFAKKEKKNKEASEKKQRIINKLLDGKPPQERIAELRKEINRVDAKIGELTSETSAANETGAYAMGVRELGNAGDCRLCIRGESTKRGDSVPRGFVTVMSGGEKPTFTSKSSGRLELARWIASPEHPLTARVMANRVWHHLFGAGIVKTVDNFGATGEPPTHPELLDYLASRFVEQGWSLKKLIREIVLSRVYGLSSEHHPDFYIADADNRFVWRHSPRRLDAEAIRDSLLHVSGQLELKPLSGTLIARFGTQEVRNDLGGNISRTESKHRSIYLPMVRNNTPVTLEAFDAADSSLIVGARDATTVPSQALFLMNSSFMRDCASGLTERLFADAKADDARRLNLAYQLAFGRAPTTDEKTRAMDYLKETTPRFTTVGGSSAKKEKDDQASFEAARRKAWSTLCQALLASAEFRFVE